MGSCQGGFLLFSINSSKAITAEDGCIFISDNHLYAQVAKWLSIEKEFIVGLDIRARCSSHLGMVW